MDNIKTVAPPKSSSNSKMPAKEEEAAVTPPVADPIPEILEEEDPKTIEDVLACVFVDETN